MLKTATCEAFYKWQAIVKREENSKHYFLFITTEQAIIVPKRVLKTNFEKIEFEKILNSYVSLEAEIGHGLK